MAAREFRVVAASPPCSTYSVTRSFAASAEDPGPPVVRDIHHPDGFEPEQVPPKYRAELQRAQRLNEHVCGLLYFAHTCGADLPVESVAPRHDREYLDGR